VAFDPDPEIFRRRLRVQTLVYPDLAHPRHTGTLTTARFAYALARLCLRLVIPHCRSHCRRPDERETVLRSPRLDRWRGSRNICHLICCKLSSHAYRRRYAHPTSRPPSQAIDWEITLLAPHSAKLVSAFTFQHLQNSTYRCLLNITFCMDLYYAFRKYFVPCKMQTKV
jgi:hypothetical protein